MMKNSLIAIVLVSLMACAPTSNNKSAENQVASPSPSSEQTADTKSELKPTSPTRFINENSDDEFALEQSYFGKNLTLLFPHSRNLGWIQLNQPDSEQLFKTLQVQVTQKTNSSAKSRLKSGFDVTCTEFQIDSQTTSSCFIYFDYSSGVVSPVVERLNKVKNPVKPDAEYKGQNLSWAARGDRQGQITLTGSDAKILFFAMDVQIKIPPTRRRSLPSRRKDGGDLSCVEQVADLKSDRVIYTCQMKLDYATGFVAPIKD